jgi:hypothetical protein
MVRDSGLDDDPFRTSIPRSIMAAPVQPALAAMFDIIYAPADATPHASAEISARYSIVAGSPALRWRKEMFQRPLR